MNSPVFQWEYQCFCSAWTPGSRTSPASRPLSSISLSPNACSLSPACSHSYTRGKKQISHHCILPAAHLEFLLSVGHIKTFSLGLWSSTNKNTRRHQSDVQSFRRNRAYHDRTGVLICQNTCFTPCRATTRTQQQYSSYIRQIASK